MDGVEAAFLRFSGILVVGGLRRVVLGHRDIAVEVAIPKRGLSLEDLPKLARRRLVGQIELADETSEQPQLDLLAGARPRWSRSGGVTNLRPLEDVEPRVVVGRWSEIVLLWRRREGLAAVVVSPTPPTGIAAGHQVLDRRSLGVFSPLGGNRRVDVRG